MCLLQHHRRYLRYLETLIARLYGDLGVNEPVIRGEKKAGKRFTREHFRLRVGVEKMHARKKQPEEDVVRARYEYPLHAVMPLYSVGEPKISSLGSERVVETHDVLNGILAVAVYVCDHLTTRDRESGAHVPSVPAFFLLCNDDEAWISCRDCADDLRCGVRRIIRVVVGDQNELVGNAAFVERTPHRLNDR